MISATLSSIWTHNCSSVEVHLIGHITWKSGAENGNIVNSEVKCQSLLLVIFAMDCRYQQLDCVPVTDSEGDIQDCEDCPGDPPTGRRPSYMSHPTASLDVASPAFFPGFFSLLTIALRCLVHNGVGQHAMKHAPCPNRNHYGSRGFLIGDAPCAVRALCEKSAVFHNHPAPYSPCWYTRYSLF